MRLKLKRRKKSLGINSKVCQVDNNCISRKDKSALSIKHWNNIQSIENFSIKNLKKSKMDKKETLLLFTAGGTKCIKKEKEIMTMSFIKKIFCNYCTKVQQIK